jgi:hypothetical protein
MSTSLLQAEARQRQFEQTPVGKAAYKSVAEAKRTEQRSSKQQDNLASGWLS